MKIDPEFVQLIPPLSAEERARLEASIVAEGCRDPLVVWVEAEILLDGHNRMEICQKLGKPWNTSGLSFADRGAAMAWMIGNQFARRNLNAWQRAELVLKLEPLLKTQAKDRMSDGGKGLQISGTLHVDRQLAEVAAVSHDTIQKARVIAEKADEATKRNLRKGGTSINAEFLRLKQPGRLLSSASNEWYTPPEYIEAARRVLGEIDLDPASCEIANRTVGALDYFDTDADGLSRDWPGRVWLNPPYGGMSAPFTGRLIAQYRAGITKAAIVLLNASVTPNAWFAPLWDYLLCFTDHRISFISPNGGQKGCNTVGSVIVYVGSDEARFVEEFSRFGPVVRRVGSLAAEGAA